MEARNRNAAERGTLLGAGSHGSAGRFRRVGKSPLGAVLAVLLVALLGAAPAGGPTDRIRGTIDRTIEILGKQELKAKARREERRALLRREIEPVFGFDEMSKRALGTNWGKRTPQEKDEFVRLFRELMENSYLGKIESYQGERILYVKETIDPPYAVVNTMIVTSASREIPVDYRLIRTGDQWRIYDVVIEGISLVNNYRSQFNGLLQRGTFAEMLDKLRATVKRQAS